MHLTPKQADFIFKLRQQVAQIEEHMRIFLAAKLFEAGKLSSGQAAALADLSKRAFIEIIGKYGVSIFSQTEEELESDFANASQVFQ